MLKSFILIVIFSGPQKGGVATAEFATLEACQVAVEALQEQESFTRHFVGICVDNGVN